MVSSGLGVTWAAFNNWEQVRGGIKETAAAGLQKVRRRASWAKTGRRGVLELAWAARPAAPSNGDPWVPFLQGRLLQPGATHLWPLSALSVPSIAAHESLGAGGVDPCFTTWEKDACVPRTHRVCPVSLDG